MCRRQRDAQAVPGQHHHDMRRAGFLGEIFGMTGEGNAGIIDDAFMYRRRDHRGKFTGQATVNGTIEQPEDVSGIGRIEHTCFRRRGERTMQHVKRTGQERVVWRPVAQFDAHAKLPRAFSQQVTVGQNDQTMRSLRPKTCG